MKVIRSRPIRKLAKKYITCFNRLSELMEEIEVHWTSRSDATPNPTLWRAEGIYSSLSDRKICWDKALYVTRNEVGNLQKTQMWSFRIRTKMVSCLGSLVAYIGQAMLNYISTLKTNTGLVASSPALLLNKRKVLLNRVATPHATWKAITNNCWAPLNTAVQMGQCYS